MPNKVCAWYAYLIRRSIRIEMENNEGKVSKEKAEQQRDFARDDHLYHEIYGGRDNESMVSVYLKERGRKG